MSLCAAVAGIDVGSVAAKAIVLDPDTLTCLGQAVLPTGWNPAEAGENALKSACVAASIDRNLLCRTIGTGYGRVSLPFVTKALTEITCHARGAFHLFPGARTVIDIGGQDSKVISLDDDGSVRDFVMNDKCAAGTGRFLQVLSGILAMPLDALGEAASRGRPVPVSSMCAVFAETEIVGLLARGTSPDDVAAGVYLSIARRIRALSSRIPMRGECIFSGGLAVNPSFAEFLSKELGVQVNIPAYPQLLGALGAAILAGEGREESKTRHQKRDVKKLRKDKSPARGTNMENTDEVCEL